jgi:hypothetical protein
MLRDKKDLSIMYLNINSYNKMREFENIWYTVIGRLIFSAISNRRTTFVRVI